MTSWTELSDDEYRTVWDRFYTDFAFKPAYHERVRPAIIEPDPFVTFDISTELASHTIDEIDDLFLTTFRSILPTAGLVYWLDWQHTCYCFSPHAAEADQRIHWYPDGDYCMLLANDFSFGTFGHPWQESLCVFGAPLLDRAGHRLRGLLDVLRESTPPQKGG